ncbi:dihydrodipicolinate synthase family protein [Salinirubrum litoreum]|uniref:Dihydrodipicolinate synthase family protein n=1 Tax=Salinirubrum litoreum TaxID=1126234 RepID=A0ABD5RCM0_9EURY|nr:dihydrodipicolinate synthase family protein [Salinirubrum litoreum]
MHGIGPPLATPFTREGDLDTDRLRRLVEWVESRGVDFLVPCGSNGETELMTADERARVIEVVAEEASVPVLAGTGSPGLRETLAATDRAASAGADGALVVTPFYYGHDDETLEAYYRDVADASDLPVYLYSVPVYTDVALDPVVVGRLAEHPNVAGMKDTTSDLATFQRKRVLTEDADFDLFVGTAGVLAHALDAGADGGVLALANVAPSACAEMLARHRAGDHDAARRLNRRLLDLNRTITAEYGVPGLKAAMRFLDAPVGYSRRPHHEVGDDAREAVEAQVSAVADLLD